MGDGTNAKWTMLILLFTWLLFPGGGFLWLVAGQDISAYLKRRSAERRRARSLPTARAVRR